VRAALPRLVYLDHKLLKAAVIGHDSHGDGTAARLDKDGGMGSGVVGA
jgi:hypothetical protein